MLKFLENIDENTIYDIIVYVYLAIGILYVIFDRSVPSNYTFLVIFFTVKMLFNYKKCTFSYLECKLRKVKREDGYLASLLDRIVDLRDSKQKNILYGISAVIIMHTDFLKKYTKL
jgi:hypothetical protein